MTMSACRITLSVDNATDSTFLVDCDVNVRKELGASTNIAGSLAHKRLSPFDAERITRRVSDTGQRIVSRSRCSFMPTMRALEVGEARGALVDIVVPITLDCSDQSYRRRLNVNDKTSAAAVLRQRRSISTDRLYLEPIEEEHGSQAHQHRLYQQTCFPSVTHSHVRRYSAPNSVPAEAD